MRPLAASAILQSGACGCCQMDTLVTMRDAGLQTDMRALRAICEALEAKS
jgi:hypothetical protein